MMRHWPEPVKVIERVAGRGGELQLQQRGPHFEGTPGLRLIRDCLLPGGVACFWCARREPALERRLRRVFGPPVYESVPEETGQEGGFYLTGG